MLRCTVADVFLSGRSAFQVENAKQSGIFALYPLFPTELISQNSDEPTLEIARRSVKAYTGPTTS